jgi:ABC-type lipoprotein release transport system permease subunit
MLKGHDSNLLRTINNQSVKKFKLKKEGIKLSRDLKSALGIGNSDSETTSKLGFAKLEMNPKELSLLHFKHYGIVNTKSP